MGANEVERQEFRAYIQTKCMYCIIVLGIITAIIGIIYAIAKPSSKRTLIQTENLSNINHKIKKRNTPEKEIQEMRNQKRKEIRYTKKYKEMQREIQKYRDKKLKEIRNEI